MITQIRPNKLCKFSKIVLDMPLPLCYYSPCQTIFHSSSMAEQSAVNRSVLSSNLSCGAKTNLAICGVFCYLGIAIIQGGFALCRSFHATNSYFPQSFAHYSGFAACGFSHHD